VRGICVDCGKNVFHSRRASIDNAIRCKRCGKVSCNNCAKFDMERWRLHDEWNWLCRTCKADQVLSNDDS
jgi:hypothetical protein